MGPAIRQDDHLISSLLDLANLRFARCVTEAASPPLNPQFVVDGIDELKSLQQKFDIFSDDHSLSDSFAVLGLGGFWNPELKNKFYGYLGSLARQLFAMDNANTVDAGDRGIATALRKNFDLDVPYPVYFMTHESGQDPRVLASYGTPLPYMADTYLIISLPMTPWPGRDALLPAGPGGGPKP
jgi:hypothetical protein